jgi:hypothetical protein
VLIEQGDFSAALVTYGIALAIRDRLAKTVPAMPNRSAITRSTAPTSEACLHSRATATVRNQPFEGRAIIEKLKALSGIAEGSRLVRRAAQMNGWLSAYGKV